MAATLRALPRGVYRADGSPRRRRPPGVSRSRFAWRSISAADGRESISPARRRRSRGSVNANYAITLSAVMLRLHGARPRGDPTERRGDAAPRRACAGGKRRQRRLSGGGRRRQRGDVTAHRRRPAAGARDGGAGPDPGRELWIDEQSRGRGLRPAPRARVLLPRDRCWRCRGGTASCGGLRDPHPHDEHAQYADRSARGVLSVSRSRSIGCVLGAAVVGSRTRWRRPRPRDHAARAGRCDAPHRASTFPAWGLAGGGTGRRGRNSLEHEGPPARPSGQDQPARRGAAMPFASRRPAAAAGANRAAKNDGGR